MSHLALALDRGEGEASNESCWPPPRRSNGSIDAG
jgi:hypothetical protein